MYTSDDFKSDLQRHLANIQSPYYSDHCYGDQGGQIIAEAYESAASDLARKAEVLAWEDAQTEFEQHNDNSPLTMIELIKKWIRQCDNASAPEAPTDSQNSRDTSGGKPLSPAQEKAYHSYEAAEKAMLNSGFSRSTDKDVYDWLTEHWTGSDDYELPAFETWQRYVRLGRNYYGTKKNSPRAGRTGRSIVQKDQI